MGAFVALIAFDVAATEVNGAAGSGTFAIVCLNCVSRSFWVCLATSFSASCKNEPVFVNCNGFFPLAWFDDVRQLNNENDFVFVSGFVLKKKYRSF